MLSPRKMKTMEIINIDWLKIILQEPLYFFFGAKCCAHLSKLMHNGGRVLDGYMADPDLNPNLILIIYLDLDNGPSSVGPDPGSYSILSTIV